jgi:hypothetical protein
MKTAIKIFALLLLVTCTSTTVFAQMRGDVNLDNYVSAPDAHRIITNWGIAAAGTPWTEGDVAPYPGGDDQVDFTDLTEVVAYWGSGTPVPLSPIVQANPAMQWAEVIDPNVPAGYRCWDFMLDTASNLEIMEMILTTNTTGDIYQHPLWGAETEPDPYYYAPFPELEFDTYVTLGAWSFPTPTVLMGGAIDIEAGSMKVFNDQDLNITWTTRGDESGPGIFQVARITVADTAVGIWEIAAWETGNDDPSYFQGSIVNGEIFGPFLLGDANNDGVVSAGDYSSVQGKFGNTGDPDIPGDANCDGVVSAGDYSSVQANFGNISADSLLVIPEPATIFVMAIGGLASLYRKRK